jgi:hypothetical protein
MEFKNKKPTVKIKLTNGQEITCNADHKFFFEGKWMAISDILKLKDEQARTV